MHDPAVQPRRTSARRAAAGAATTGLLALAGCAGFGPPQAATLQRLRPMALAALVPGRFEVELDTPGLTGTFDAIAAVVDHRLRLQLFPDVGGKVLDVEFDGSGVWAEMPGASYAAAAPLDRAEPHLALVLAMVLAELLAPVEPPRVRGERPVGNGGRQLDLRPALGSGTVRATLGADGAIEAYAFELGWLSFTLAADGTLAGRGVRGWLRPLGS
ncbi:MAG: hypothetical protein MUC36_27815 [Planctomycetes bacterium]|nr:hypothetical protein [Planctomycetota bacterium]